MKSLDTAKRGGAVALSLGLFALGLAAVPSAANAATESCASPTLHVHVDSQGVLTENQRNLLDAFVDRTNGNTPGGKYDHVEGLPNASNVAMCSGTGTDSDSSAWTATVSTTDPSVLEHTAAAGLYVTSADFYGVRTGPADTRSLPSYHIGQTFVIRTGISPNGAQEFGVNFGAKTDLPLFGDWNGDGDQAPGVYRPGNRTFYFASDQDGRTVVKSFVFGAAGDKPIVGDFDGDGIESVGLYRPSTSTFFLTNDNKTVVSSLRYGTGGDVPIVGDWDGDGTATIGVYRPSTATFYRPSAAPVRYGKPGDSPVVGDWDGNHTTTFGVVRGTTWYVARTGNATSYPAFTFGPKGAAWLALTVTK